MQKIELSAEFGVGRRRLAIHESSPGANAALFVLVTPISILGAAAKLDLKEHERSGRVSFSLTCEERPESEKVLLQKYYACDKLRSNRELREEIWIPHARHGNKQLKVTSTSHAPTLRLKLCS